MAWTMIVVDDSVSKNEVCFQCKKPAVFFLASMHSCRACAGAALEAALKKWRKP